jgi:hypothetical protein
MSLSLEQSTGLNLVLAPASAGAALSGTTGAATTYSMALFGYIINGVPYNKAVQSGVASPTTDGNTGLASTLSLAINQARVYVWGINAAGTIAVFAGPVASWPNVSGTSLGAVPLQFPAVPGTYAVLAYQVLANGSNGSAFAFGSTNWSNTGMSPQTPVNTSGFLPSVPPLTP